MKWLFSILIITIYFNAIAQLKKKPPMPPGPHDRAKPSKFVYLPYKSIIQKIPIDHSSQIILVSFRPEKDRFSGSYHYQFPENNDTIEFSKISEFRILNFAEAHALLKILYYKEIRFGVSSEFKIGCYWPRNAIVFLNNLQKISGYIELCFECQNFRLSPENFEIEDLERNKIFTLKKYFSELGIKFGTSETELK